MTFGIVNPVEALKHLALILRRNANAGIGHIDLHKLAGSCALRVTAPPGGVYW